MWMKKSLIQVCLFALCLCLGLSTTNAKTVINHWQTSGGARVYFVETHDNPIVDINISFDAGSRYDDKNKAGLAALTNGLLDSGVKTLSGEELNEARISDDYAQLGAQRSSQVVMDKADFGIRVLSDSKIRDKAIKLTAQVLAFPTFPSDVVSRDKKRVIASIKESLTRPASVLSRAFFKEMYGEHPYGMQTTQESIDAISRSDLKAFHQRYYVSNRATIAIVGDLTQQEAKQIAEELTKQLPVSKETLPVIDDVKKTKQHTVRIAHEATQSHVAVGMPSLIRGDKDFFAIRVGNYILGSGGFTSRLMNEVREKRGLSYSVYSSFRPMLAPGPFMISLETKKEQADEALAVVQTVLKDYLSKGPTKKELKDAKDHLINGFAMQIDNNSKMVSVLATIGYYHLPLDYLDTWQDNVLRVSAQDIVDAFNRKVHLDELVTVIVGKQ